MTGAVLHPASIRLPSVLSSPSFYLPLSPHLSQTQYLFVFLLFFPPPPFTYPYLVSYPRPARAMDGWRRSFSLRFGQHQDVYRRRGRSSRRVRVGEHLTRGSLLRFGIWPTSQRTPIRPQRHQRGRLHGTRCGHARHGESRIFSAQGISFLWDLVLDKLSNNLVAVRLSYGPTLALGS